MPDMFLNALQLAFAPTSLIACVVGVVLGMTFGAMPGLTATMGIALLLPLTYGLDPVPALIMLTSIYQAAMTGGSVPAILLYTPGTPGAAATALDGYPMAQQGFAGKAIGYSVIGSVIGGLFGAVALLVIAPPLSRVALAFGPAEYFWLAIFGLSAVAGLTGKSVVKGLMAAAFGLLLSTVGGDILSGYPRMTFGIPELMGGVGLVPAMIGLFSIPQVVHLAAKSHLGASSIPKVPWRSLFPRIGEVFGMARLWIQSCFIGLVVGILPGAGGDIASFVAYNEARRFSRRPDLFGKGSVEGVAAPECANNSVTGGALIPLLTLGIPGSSAAAVLMGGLMIQGLQPGPELFTVHGSITYAVIIGFIFANLVMLVLGMLGSHIFSKALMIPNRVLAPLILLFCVVGSYSVNNSMFDVYVMLFFGLVGYYMRRYGFPAAPVVLGLILGGMAEQGLRQGFRLGRGDPMYFFSHPISLLLIALIVLALFSPIVLGKIMGRQKSEEVLAAEEV